MDFSEYVRHGWALCGIDAGSKSPRYAKWQLNPLPADACAELPGAGLLHALSGTCALDIDNLEQARAWLAERGVAVDTLLGADDAVRISSGRPNRAKLLYRLSKPMRTLKPTYSGIELRCATADGASVQDVLPGSIHPDTGKPYVWQTGVFGDWRELPTIPATLLAAWRAESATLAVAGEVGTGVKMASIELRKLLRGKDPNVGYDAWLRIGMALHDATGGAAEGLRLWNEWSKAGKSYKGEQDLYTHWVSFQSAPGKQVVTADSLKIDTVAEASDFEVFEITEPAPPTVEEVAARKATRAENKTKRQGALDILNSRLVYVRESERYFDTTHHHLIGSDNAIKHQFTPLMPIMKGARMDPVKILVASTDKRYVKALGFHPGVGALFDYKGETFANTYKSQIPEEIEPTKDELAKIAWLFERIDDPIYRVWLQQFLGHVIQRPGVKINSAPLIWSSIQGNGKTTLLKVIPSLLVGARYSKEVSCALLNSDFNDYLLNAWHVNLTEFRAGTRGERTAITSKLKAWITDDTVALHPKGLTAYSMPNFFFITATSNEDDAAMVDNDDRRWGIHELHAAQFTVEEQKWIYNDFLNGPRAAGVLRWYFMRIDIKGFGASAKAPDTEARRDMIEASASSDIGLLEGMLERREGLFSRDIVMTHEVAEYIQKNSSNKFATAIRVGKLLTRPPFNGKAIQFAVGTARYRAIVVRNLSRWDRIGGREIMAHINGEDVEISVDDDPLLA